MKLIKTWGTARCVNRGAWGRPVGMNAGMSTVVAARQVSGAHQLCRPNDLDNYIEDERAATTTHPTSRRAA